MGKPFFYRITAADFLAAVVTTPDEERGAWVLQLALDMVLGDKKSASSKFAKSIISEAHEFSGKKRDAANKRWNAQHKHSNALHMHSNASSSSSSSNSTEAVTETKENLKPLSDKSNAYTEDFLKWWAIYPKKTGKGTAGAKWKKLKVPLSAACEALAWQKVSQQWIDGYVPNPETYLNQRRWEDEPTPEVTIISQKVSQIDYARAEANRINQEAAEAYRKKEGF